MCAAKTKLLKVKMVSDILDPTVQMFLIRFTTLLMTILTTKIQILYQVGIMAYGKLVYFGGAEQMLEYFDKLGYPCPTYSNPTDHYGRSFVSFWYCLKIYNIFVFIHLICLSCIYFNLVIIG